MKVESFIKKVKASFQPVLFMDAGPQVPEPVSVKWYTVLETSDVVVYTGALVPDDLLGRVQNGTQAFNSEAMTLKETIRAVENAYHEGHRVVWLHTGDPSPYAPAISEQMAKLDKRHIEYRVLPGGSVAFEAAVCRNLPAE